MCLTATSIQNKVEEVYSLIKFLCINWEEFHKEIITPMKKGFHEKEAPARFNKFVKANNVMNKYAVVLVLLLRLRQACLHPSLTLEPYPGEEEQSNATRVKIAESMPTSAVNRLLRENTDFSDIINIYQYGGWAYEKLPTMSRRFGYEGVTSLEAFLKMHAPDLHHTFIESAEELEENHETTDRAKKFVSSAKINKLLEILKDTHETMDGKDKTIVFSQFVKMLDIVGDALEQKGYKFVRYDGSMNVKQRDAALTSFFEKPEVTVLLVSTKCGSLGLNLTAANRVVIMDNWWNPSLENQAMIVCIVSDRPNLCYSLG
ncbi:P-loop containing nucleoside triphosphate hydrolase protein [Radiomyces spectabilis]|uniref:P-loop containing nucleoside triphosphate hydrolase protein n=1 Tax=Radiomyces spectabilis TaxID=64574 RepID=UPI00221ED388|nr:P-loop containing nucleoside triphosphate hydrolase protein [Radiomyces spectabilis]KAI8381233.1 P-loop containing nucleoside triphosphate hydrolase protein [Radiomyces spectabilis]